MPYHRHWSETSCIMVDLSVIDSVQRAKKKGFSGSSSPPFAWVIDRFYGTFPISKPKYRGAFKIPLDTLLHEFYVDARDFKTIEPLCSPNGGEFYRSVYSNSQPGTRSAKNNI
jgi:hypothetical protein